MPIPALTAAPLSAIGSRLSRETGPSRIGERVGIDVGAAGLQVTHVVRRRDGWHWTARAAIDHAQPLSSPVGAGEVDAPTAEAVGRAVAASLPRSVDGRRRLAIAALPSSVSVLRTPADASPEAFGASVRTDLGASLSPGGSIQSCSWTVGRGSRQMVYAVSGSASEAAGEAIEQAGYTCRRIDSRPHAIARTLNLEEASDARIVLDWGWNDCMLVFTSDAPDETFCQPSLCRSLRGYGLASAARIAGRGDEDARQALENSLIPATDVHAQRRAADRNRELLQPLIKAAAAELIRSLRLADTLPGVEASGPIVVCGAAAAAAELPELLSAALGRPVRRWRWGGRSRPTAHPYAPDDCLFAVSLALACGETR